MTDQDIENAVALLDGWTDKLTWPRFIAVLATEIGHAYSKQALWKQTRIMAALTSARKRIKKSTKAAGGTSNGSSAVAHMIHAATAQEARADRLEKTNEELYERFNRWAYNAHLHGITEEQLDKPLPAVAPPGKEDSKKRS